MVAVKKQTFKVFSDKERKGKLIPLEAGGDIPFPILRSYIIYDLDDSLERGGHAHHKTTQILICLKGVCEVILDDGRSQESVLVNSPSEGLILEPYIWHTMCNFSNDCILLAFASTLYEEKDYIRDYTQFLEVVNGCSV